MDENSDSTTQESDVSIASYIKPLFKKKFIV